MIFCFSVARTVCRAEVEVADSDAVVGEVGEAAGAQAGMTGGK